MIETRYCLSLIFVLVELDVILFCTLKKKHAILLESHIHYPLISLLIFIGFAENHEQKIFNPIALAAVQSSRVVLLKRCS